FEEIAKFRAARRIWAKIMKEDFQAQNPKSWKMRFHTQTGGSTLTAQQPDNNIVRVTLQPLSAVLGGTQSLHTNSRDEALLLPSEGWGISGLRRALSLADGSRVADAVDPAGGCYCVESLTDEGGQDIHSYLACLDAISGAVNAVEEGYMQREIQKDAYETQK